MGYITFPMEINEAVVLMATVTFMVILSLSLLVLLVLFVFWKNDLQRQLATIRLIGGMSVFIFALATNNPYIQVVALFIGGLLIASERFMVFLAAVFNSNGEGVHQIVSQYESLTQEERNKKQEKEIAEIDTPAEIPELTEQDKTDTHPKKDDDDNNDPGGSTPGGIAPATVLRSDGVKDDSKLEIRRPTSMLERVAAVEKIDELVIRRVHERISRFDETVRRYVKIHNPDGSTTAYDAVVVKKNTQKIVSAIETKYFNHINYKTISNVIRTLSRKYKENDYRTIIFIVIPEYDLYEIRKLLEIRKDIKKHYPKLGIVFYQITTDNYPKLEALNDEDMVMVTDLTWW